MESRIDTFPQRPALATTEAGAPLLSHDQTTLLSSKNSKANPEVVQPKRGKVGSCGSFTLSVCGLGGEGGIVLVDYLSL